MCPPPVPPSALSAQLLPPLHPCTHVPNSLKLAWSNLPSPAPFGPISVFSCLFLAGMGGLVAAHVAAQQEGLWAGLILNSPLINVEWNLVMQLQSKVAGFLSWAAPRAKMVPAVNVKDMSQDPAVVSNPLLANPPAFLPCPAPPLSHLLLPHRL